jgi:hypothetical protein
MKLHKHLHEMTELEAFECLQGAAIAIKIIADKNYVTEDAIFDSWKIQKIIQDKINLNNKD